MKMLFPEGKIKALTLSYDDGVVFDRRLIEIMKAHGLKGTFNINSGRFSDGTNSRKLTAKEAFELYTDSGMEVALHGVEHLHLAELSDERKVYEIMQDKINLEKIFGTLVRGMAYAYGNFDDACIEVLKRCGIEYGRIGKFTESFDIPKNFLALTPTCHHKNEKLMELARKFVDIKIDPAYPWRTRAQLFYVWGHSYEFNDNDNWYIMEEFAEFIGGRDDIWYATNIEIIDYINAFRRLVFSADGSIVMNPTSTQLWFEERGKNYTILPGQTLVIDR